MFKRYLSGNDARTPTDLSGYPAQDSENVDVARVTAVPDNKSVPAQNDLIRHRNQLNSNLVPPCTGTEKLSGTYQAIDYIEDN